MQSYAPAGCTAPPSAGTTGAGQPPTAEGDTLTSLDKIRARWVLPTNRVPAFNYVPAERPLVVFDTETTGVTGEDRIVSIAAIQLGPDLLPMGEYVHYVFNPGRPSHPMARKVHGLSDDFLSRQPLFADHARELRNLFRGRVLVAHNLAFDLRMLNQELAAAGLPRIGGRSTRYCTMQEFRIRYPGRPAKLDAVLAHLGLAPRTGTLHGAFEDTNLAMQVLQRLHHANGVAAMKPVGFHNLR